MKNCLFTLYLVYTNDFIDNLTYRPTIIKEVIYRNYANIDYKYFTF